MDARRFDGVTKRLATTAPRRGVLQGLAALGVGSLGVLGLTEAGSAQVEAQDGRCRRCVRRCVRRCGNRGERCVGRCVDRRCDTCGTDGTDGTD
jgi:hypothetical protein